MHNETTPSLAAWTSLLSIATRFEMKRIRTRAIAEIIGFRPRMDPVDQIVLALKHDVPEWIPLGYAALCQRDDPLEVEEAERLGIRTTALLAKARERVRKIGGALRDNYDREILPWEKNAASILSGEITPPTPNPFDVSLVDRVLKEIFWPEPERSEKVDECNIPVKKGKKKNGSKKK